MTIEQQATTIEALEAMARDRSVDIRVRLAALQAVEAIRHACEIARIFAEKGKRETS